MSFPHFNEGLSGWWRRGGGFRAYCTILLCIIVETLICDLLRNDMVSFFAVYYSVYVCTYLHMSPFDKFNNYN